MTVLKFKGIVTTYDFDCPYNTRDTECPVPYHVGGRCVGGEIREVFSNETRVYVALADEMFTGDLTLIGATAGYSEWTPAYPGKLWVGEHDLGEVLDRYEDKEITLWVADEPVNTLEDSDEGPIDWSKYE